MNYIIDPAVFYWINVLGILQTFLAVFGSLLIVTGITLALIRWYCSDDIYDTEYDATQHKHIKVLDEEVANTCNTLAKWAKICIPLGVVMAIVSIFIPGKVTSIEMLVAKTATFDNMNLTIDGVKELIDYIVKAIKSAV